jgi:hypothetical protein
VVIEFLLHAMSILKALRDGAKGPCDVEDRGTVNIRISKLAYAPAGRVRCLPLDRPPIREPPRMVSLQGLGDFRGNSRLL